MYYIGLMSGASVDGVDAALVTLTDPGGLKLEATHPYSIQIGNPAVIAERTGITTVADFRARYRRGR